MSRAEADTNKRGKGAASTPFDIMANKLHKRCRVLMLDGLNITQPSEVLLVRDFFRAMWLRGITVVVTANQPIQRLYRDGHNREALVEFFPEFRERCPEVEILSDKNYRREAIESSKSCLVGLSEENQIKANILFTEAAGEHELDVQIAIPGNSRTIAAKALNANGDVVRFDFSELCGKAFGRSDYAHLATGYRTVFIDNIPELKAEELETFKRFEALIEMLYDKKVLLHATSAVPLADIYPHADELSMEEKAPIERFQSIVTEMSSSKYPSMAWLLRRHLTLDAATKL